MSQHILLNDLDLGIKREVSLYKMCVNK